MQILHLHSYLKLSLVLVIISSFSFFCISCNNSPKKNEKEIKVDTAQKATNQCEVWPGDADNNGVVSIADLLSIGLMYEKIGAKRTGATIQFESQTANNWKTKLPNNADIAHTDCNGDSIINNKDTLAIIKNFAQTHKGSSGQFPTIGTTAITLDVVSKTACDSNTSPNCSKITFKMSLDNIKNLYGASIAFKYNNKKIDSIIYAKLDDSCLNITGKDFINILKHDNEKKELYIGLTKTNPNAGDVPCGSLGNITMEIMEFDDDDESSNPFFMLGSKSDNLVSSLNSKNVKFTSINKLNINK